MDYIMASEQAGTLYDYVEICERERGVPLEA